MKKTILCFGVYDHEKEYFIDIGKNYNYNLELRKEFFYKENINECYGYEIIITRGNCYFSKEIISDLKDHGLKYLLTRSAGFDHIDIAACKNHGVEVANVPAYSPNAIAELALNLSLMLLRHTAMIVERTSRGDFTIDPMMFSKELRSCTVGIIGMGKIGNAAAKLFKGVGAKILAYDINKTEDYKFVELDYLLANSDIVSLHIPYIRGVNDDFVNKDMIAKMKNGAIFINTARGELHDLSALIEAIENNKLSGVGVDVLKGEINIFNYCGQYDALTKKAIDLFPKIIITPHIAALTQEALINMIDISLKNLDEYLLNGKCKNSLIK